MQVKFLVVEWFRANIKSVQTTVVVSSLTSERRLVSVYLGNNVNSMTLTNSQRKSRNPDFCANRKLMFEETGSMN